MIPEILKKLRITNFQAHEERVVKFSPGITSIVGPTDVGKSAIIRAIRWLCLNDPSGEEFRRWDTDMTTVGIRIGKSVIQRKRGKSTNSYVIGGKENKAFGRDVPLDVQEALGVGPINFQSQQDGPYWFNLSAGQVSQRLNEMVDLTLIDSSTANINTKIRSAAAERGVIIDRISSFSEEATSLEYIGKMDAELKGVSQKFAILAQKREQADNLKKHIELLEEAKSVEHLASKELELLEVVVFAGSSWMDIQYAQTELRDLMTGLDQASKESSKSIPSLERLEKAHETVFGLWESETLLSGMMEDLENATADEQRHQKAFEKAKTAWDELSKEQCPLCGRTG